MSNEERETFGHDIQVELTEEEVAVIDKRIAQIDREVVAIAERKSAANAVFKEESDALLRERKPLLVQSDTKKAIREIKCYHERDERQGRMLTLSCDTGEIVDERALTADERGAVEDERQGNLFDGGAGGPGTDLSEDEEPAGDADADANLAEYLAQAGADSSDEETLAH